MATGQRNSEDAPSSERFVVPLEEGTDAPSRFGPEIAPTHWRFDPANHDDIYVVGDVHGCIDELRTLWDRLDPSPEDLVVFVGDLVRKGPDSAAVVEFVRSHPQCVSVRGNNEAKLIHDRIDTDPFDGIISEVSTFPHVVSWGDSMVVHGGVHPEDSLDTHDTDEILEMRSVPAGNGYDGPFWFEQYDRKPRVFFGHTVLAEPYVSDSAIGLDTGCVYGGSLTAYDCREDSFISVPAERTYQSRDDSKILDI